MDEKIYIIWFTAAGIIGILFGIVYSFFGLAILPEPEGVLVPWGNGVYGATLIGLSSMILFTGRLAFRRKDPELMKAMLYGIYSWLIVELFFSIYYRVFFNIGVDIALMIILGIPLIKGIRLSRKEPS